MSDRVFTHRLIGPIVDPRTGQMSAIFARFLDELVTTTNEVNTLTNESAGGRPFARYAGEQRGAVAPARYDQPAQARQFASYGDDRQKVRTASYAAAPKATRFARYT